jgi:hypothetical protein
MPQKEIHHDKTVVAQFIVVCRSVTTSMNM